MGAGGGGGGVEVFKILVFHQKFVVDPLVNFMLQDKAYTCFFVGNIGRKHQLIYAIV